MATGVILHGKNVENLTLYWLSMENEALLKQHTLITGVLIKENYYIRFQTKLSLVDSLDVRK